MDETLGVKLFLAGILISFIGIILLIIASIFSGGESSGAVVIFIGPIPIIGGWGTAWPILVIIGILIAIVMILISYLMIKPVKELK